MERAIQLEMGLPSHRVSWHIGQPKVMVLLFLSIIGIIIIVISWHGLMPVAPYSLPVWGWSSLYLEAAVHFALFVTFESKYGQNRVIQSYISISIKVSPYLVTFELWYVRIGFKIPYKWWSHCLPFSREGWMASFKATSDFGALIFTFLHSCLLLLYHSVTFETKHGHIRVNIPYFWWSYCMPMSKKWLLLCVNTTGGLGALIFTSYS